MQNNLCCFINPLSGSGDGARLLAAMRNECVAIPIDFSDLPSQLRSAHHFERIAIAGGDGTLSTLLTHDDLPRCPVGIIPLGTANDLARELRIDLALGKCPPGSIAETILTSSTTLLKTWQLTIGETSVRFCNYCSFGFEGHVLRDFSRWRSNSTAQNRTLNRAMYLWFGLKHAMYANPSMRIEGTPLPRGSSLICANVRSYMGLGISNNLGTFGDEALECVSVPSVLSYLRMIVAKHLTGLSLTATTYHAPLTISGIASAVPVQVDGEFFAGGPGDLATITPLKSVEVCTKLG